jgi:hypothetical protein
VTTFHQYVCGLVARLWPDACQDEVLTLLLSLNIAPMFMQDPGLDSNAAVLAVMLIAQRLKNLESPNVQTSWKLQTLLARICGG